MKISSLSQLFILKYYKTKIDFVENLFSLTILVFVIFFVVHISGIFWKICTLEQLNLSSQIDPISTRNLLKIVRNDLNVVSIIMLAVKMEENNFLVGYIRRKLTIFLFCFDN